jgi:fructokinase
MKKILCIGEALIDMFCTDRDSSLAEAQHFTKKPGGAPTNVAAAIAALGGKVALAARVGNDPFGQQLIDLMNHFGVSTQWMIKDEEHFTTMAFVSLMENGERDFVFNRGADGHLSRDDVKFIDMADFSIVHFGSATAFLKGPLQEAYKYLLKNCSFNKLFISFDPNYRHLLYHDKKESFIRQAWEFLTACHFTKLSEEEAKMITHTDNVMKAAEHLSQKINAVFAITLGSKGALLGYKGKTEIVPGIPASVIDTTGAGDAFTGAVLYQLQRLSPEESNNLSLEDWKIIVSNANRIGAEACEHMGAMESFKYLKL